MHEFRAVLWDLDGTIVDSQEFHWLAWKQTLAPLHVRVTHEQFLRTFGQTNATILPEWLGCEPGAPQIQEVSDSKEACFRELVAQAGLTPLAGAEDWIARLHAGGWRQAIASSAPRLNIEAMLAAVRLRRFFQVIVGAEDVRHGKPDPEVFLEAAARLQTPPAHCIVVEDAKAGIEAARRAGMISIGVSPTARLDATLDAPSLAEIPHDAFARLLDSRCGLKYEPRPDVGPGGVDSLKIP